MSVVLAAAAGITDAPPQGAAGPEDLLDAMAGTPRIQRLLALALLSPLTRKEPIASSTFVEACRLLFPRTILSADHSDNAPPHGAQPRLSSAHDMKSS